MATELDRLDLIFEARPAYRDHQPRECPVATTIRPAIASHVTPSGPASAAIAARLAMPATASAEEIHSQADAINASGRIAGSLCSPTCNDGYVAALFDKRGGFTPLGSLGGFAAVFSDLSENGWGVGQADEAPLHPSDTHISKAFILDGLGLRPLGTLPSYAFSQAYGVNQKGEAVGWSYNLEDSGRTMQTFHAFVTEPRGGAMRPRHARRPDVHRPRHHRRWAHRRQGGDRRRTYACVPVRRRAHDRAAIARRRFRRG